MKVNKGYLPSGAQLKATLKQGHTKVQMPGQSIQQAGRNATKAMAAKTQGLDKSVDQRASTSNARNARALKIQEAQLLRQSTFGKVDPSHAPPVDAPSALIGQPARAKAPKPFGRS